MATLSIRCFGEFAVERDGAAVALPRSRKTRALLAYLVVTAQPKRREHLCELLWDLPDDPKGALRWSLSKARKLVDDQAHKRIEADRERVAFVPHGAEVDLHAVRTAIANGVDAIDTVRLKAIAEILAQEFLDGLDSPNFERYQAWLTAERAAVATLHRTTLEELVTRLAGEQEAQPYIRVLAAIGDNVPGPPNTVWLNAAGRAPAPAATPAPVATLRPDGQDRPSIAVLPFDDRSDAAESEWLADGITEEIITGLARSRVFFVIARNSTFAYKQRSVNVATAALELGVRYVLDGSVQARGARVRIKAQLIDGATGSLLWAERFDRDLSDVFALQDEITDRVVSVLEPEINIAEARRIRAKPLGELQAWECVVRGIAHYWRWTKQDFEASERLARKAVRLEPHFARALTLLASTRWAQALSGFVRPGGPVMAEALELAKTAVSEDPNWALAHAVIGNGYLGLGKLDEAKAAAERALELAPGSSEVLLCNGIVNAYAGAPTLAIAQLETSIRLNPHDPGLFGRYQNLAGAQFALGRYPEALENARRVARMAPDYFESKTFEIACLAQLDRVDEARALAAAVRTERPFFDVSFALRRHPYKDEEVRAMLAAGLRKAGVPD